MSSQALRYMGYEEINPRVKVSKHHRKFRANGGTDNKANLIELPHNKHMAFHLLFRDFTPERIAKELNDRYIDPDYEMIAVRKPVLRNIDDVLRDIDRQ